MASTVFNAVLSPSLPAIFQAPQLLSFDRLEPRARTATFDRSLRAEVRDALWMLTRQWQFGEFQGEDAASPVFSQVEVETTRITRYAVRAQPAVAYDPALPLEVRVEREPVLDRAPGRIDLLLRLQMGQHWLRLLRHPSFAIAGDYAPLFRAAFPVQRAPDDVPNAELASNRAAWQLNHALAGRGVDGGALYAALRGGALAEDAAADGLSVAPADRAAVALAAQAFLDHFAALFVQPDGPADDAWASEHLEYQFAVAAPTPQGRLTLTADEYAQGHLDWYSFDIDPARDLVDAPGAVIDDDVITREKLTFLPVPVRFSGMPGVRWWEFEDGRTDFGEIRPDKTDIAKLLLAEFGLIYGNDWSVIPYVVPVGSLCTVRGLAVTDTFGERTLIRPAGRGPEQDWHNFRMFTLSTRGDPSQADTRLFLPPSIGKELEGPPIEQATFLRDEMANMVWAVESILPNDRLGGMNGYEAALALADYLSRRLPAPPQPPLLPNDALIRYLVGTVVPENWIPFIPVHVGGSNRAIQLQRARMVTALLDHPRGEVLRPGAPGSPYFIHEEEVPRAGAIVTRAFQRVRHVDGRTHLWLARRKRAGRGEGSSGLKFDQIEPLAPED
ncbi:MAG: hypothetical protein IT323_01470 [Anaerolineae bacterium]|nr:hypothetical protein [Anaerolineae bacterium]